MSGVTPITFGSLWATLAKDKKATKAIPKVTSSLSPEKERKIRTVLKEQYKALLGMIDAGKLTASIWELLEGANTPYKLQLQLLGGMQKDGKPLLERDWLIGAVGADGPLVCTFLQERGEVTATSLNANELVTLAATADEFEYDLGSLLGPAKPRGSIERHMDPSTSFKPGESMLYRTMQPYCIKRSGQTWEEFYVDPARVEVLRWDGGFNFIPLDLRDTGTLTTYIGAFRSGRKFNGLVLKRNYEIFVHALFKRVQDGKQVLARTSFDILSDPVKKAKIRESYEIWLEETLRELCQEDTAIIVNGSDAPLALPFLLGRGFQILAPNENMGLAFTLFPEHRKFIESREASLGNLKLHGGNVCVYEDIFGMHQSAYLIYFDLDGSFVVLEGPAGKSLPRTSRRLSSVERDIIANFELMQKQKDQFFELVKADPEAGKYTI